MIISFLSVLNILINDRHVRWLMTRRPVAARKPDCVAQAPFHLATASTTTALKIKICL